MYSFKIYITGVGNTSMQIYLNGRSACVMERSTKVQFASLADKRAKKHASIAGSMGVGPFSSTNCGRKIRSHIHLYSHFKSAYLRWTLLKCSENTQSPKSMTTQDLLVGFLSVKNPTGQVLPPSLLLPQDGITMFRVTQIEMERYGEQALIRTWKT